MKNQFAIIITLLLGTIFAYGQDKPTDFTLFSKENIEFTALKPFFYLIRQEYILMDESGKPRVRGGNNFYGKAYTIGVLSEDTKLWFPTYIRSPWEIDDTYDQLTNKSHKPECSLFGMKSYADDDYFVTQIQSIDEKDPLFFIRVGRNGIMLEKDLQDNGTLIIFYTSAASPDNFEVILHSIMFLDEIIWNSDGTAEIEELNYGDNKIIGGALFSRHMSPGNIRWRLAGFYLPVNNRWILKSIREQ